MRDLVVCPSSLASPSSSARRRHRRFRAAFLAGAQCVRGGAPGLADVGKLEADGGLSSYASDTQVKNEADYPRGKFSDSGGSVPLGPSDALSIGCASAGSEGPLGSSRERDLADSRQHSKADHPRVARLASGSSTATDTNSSRKKSGAIPEAGASASDSPGQPHPHSSETTLEKREQTHAAGIPEAYSADTSRHACHLHVAPSPEASAQAWSRGSEDSQAGSPAGTLCQACHLHVAPSPVASSLARSWGGAEVDSQAGRPAVASQSWPGDGSRSEKPEASGSSCAPDGVSASVHRFKTDGDKTVGKVCGREKTEGEAVGALVAALLINVPCEDARRKRYSFRRSALRYDDEKTVLDIVYEVVAELSGGRAKSWVSIDRIVEVAAGKGQSPEVAFSAIAEWCMLEIMSVDARKTCVCFSMQPF